MREAALTHAQQRTSTTIDLNPDLGEGFGAYTIGGDHRRAPPSPGE